MARQIIYPPALQVTLPRAVSTVPLTVECVVAHTIVGTVPGHISYISQAGNPYDHIPLDGGGTFRQVQDLACRAAATVEGNPRVIAIETDDTDRRWFPAWSPRTCGNVPPWTDAQVRALIEFCIWACVRWGIPPVLVQRARKGIRGLAYHRVGCPPGPEWRTGDERWSLATGKCCPDVARINQWKNKVVPAVAAALEPQEPDVRPDPDARYLPFEFSKLAAPTGSGPSLDVVTNQTRQSETQVTTTVVSKVNGGTATPVLQTASMIAEASGGVIGSIPWKAGGGHYGTVWDTVTGGWGGVGDQFDQRCVGAVFTATGNGYWLVSDKGGVFTYGDAAPFAGPTPWQRDVVGAKRAANGKLTIVYADGTEQTST